MTDYTDKSRGIRLQKAMAEAGVASRRACEELIAEGRVTVNNQRVTELPAWVDPVYDKIAVDGELIRNAPKKGRTHAYVALHKPRHVISSAADEFGRRNVTELVDMPGHRLYPVGRLDADSTGLMLMTDDGQLAQALTHPSFEVPKRYEVSVVGKLTEKDAQRMQKGLFLADEETGRRHKTRAKAEHVQILGHQTDRARGDRTTLRITLREGQNREIRRLLARLGYNVKRLKRTAIGPLSIKGLGVGQWRPLTSGEVRGLYKSAGLNP